MELTVPVILCYGIVLLMGVLLVNGKTDRNIIRVYNVQTLVLFGVTQLLAIDVNPMLVVASIFPLIRFFIVRPLLAYATAQAERGTAPSSPSSTPKDEGPTSRELAKSFLRVLLVLPVGLLQAWLIAAVSNRPPVLLLFAGAGAGILALLTHRLSRDLRNMNRDAEQKSERYWLEHPVKARYGGGVTGLITIISVIFAYLTVAQIAGSSPAILEDIVLPMTVALALVLLGMVMMINEDDIISHMMGLLLTENGIFLLVIVAVRENVLLAGLFSGSVFAYILGTVMILVYFVGELLARAPELRIERHRRLKG